MIGIFSGTDMIKIWNWFTAIGSFARKIQEKNTSAELSWCRNVSHRYRIVRVPNCLGAEMSRTGAEVSWCRIVPVPKYLAFTKKSNLPSLSLIILCQKTGMDRNYCLIVFIVYMSYKKKKHRVLSTSTCDGDYKSYWNFMKILKLWIFFLEFWNSLKIFEILWKLKFLKFFENFEILWKFWNLVNILNFFWNFWN